MAANDSKKAPSGHFREQFAQIRAKPKRLHYRAHAALLKVMGERLRAIEGNGADLGDRVDETQRPWID